MADTATSRGAPNPIEGFAAALAERHLASLSRAEFLRAARALSVRYVEARTSLPGRSPLDSAGKRAAFALLYAPLHFVSVTAVVERLALAERPVTRIIDLGCGTGVSSAAWAMAIPAPRPSIAGVETHPWALAEASWTWRHFGLRATARRGDMTAALPRLSGATTASLSGTALLFGWSVNELAAPARAIVLEQVVRAAGRGATVLVLEPLARRAAPWWPDWCRALGPLGGRADEWRLPNTLPSLLRRLDRDAGFVRDDLGLRSLVVG